MIGAIHLNPDRRLPIDLSSSLIRFTKNSTLFYFSLPFTPFALSRIVHLCQCFGSSRPYILIASARPYQAMPQQSERRCRPGGRAWTIPEDHLKVLVDSDR